MAGTGRIAGLSAAQRVEWSGRVEAYLELRHAYEAAQGDGDVLTGASLAHWEEARKASREALSHAFDAAYAYLDQAAPTTAPAATEARQIAQALPPDRALLSFVTVGKVRYGFLVAGRKVRAARLDGTADLLAPWGDALAHVSHLYVAPAGAPEALELPARRDADGKPLLARMGVSFVPYAGFLLATATTGVAPGQPPGASLVVADPANNLPQARIEGASVSHALPGSHLLAGDAATRDAVIAALGNAPIFHFSGHGILHPDAPWEAHLQLADGQRLTLADLLAAHPHVGLAILSGCETGRSLSLGKYESVGMPEALLSVGTHTVIATRAVVKDTDAKRFIDRFYAEGGAERPGAAYRAAALAEDATGDRSWTDFQLFGAP